MNTRPRVIRKPKIVIPFQAILFHIKDEWLSTLTDAELYERTRRYWLCNPEERKIAPTHAVAHAGKLIRAVYIIDGWDEYTKWPIDRDMSRIKDRSDPWTCGTMKRGFHGKEDAAFAHLIGQSVDGVEKLGGRPVFTYHNC